MSEKTKMDQKRREMVTMLIVVVVVAVVVGLVPFDEVDQVVVVESVTLMCGERLGSLNQCIVVF